MGRCLLENHNWNARDRDAEAAAQAPKLGPPTPPAPQVGQVATPFFRVPALPKGPFRTKNSMALESVVFCYRRSFSQSVPFSCLFLLEKQAFLSPLRSVLLRPYRIFAPYRNSLSVVFLVRKGPLGKGAYGNTAF